MKPVVAIVGRPNVGKSTLFNRLARQRKALVHDRPGVTRDRMYVDAELLGREVILIDTGGLEPVPETTLLESMRHQSLLAVDEADVILFVVDAVAGFTPADMEVSDLLRRSQTPVILAVNKVDGPKHEDFVFDFYQCGFDPVIGISAEHGRGIYDLLEAVIPLLAEAPEGEDDDICDSPFLSEDEAEAGESSEPSGPIRIAVLGRPNIGKSTLINRLLGENRHVVHDSPGTTMDTIDSAITIDGQDYVLVDTAGVRRRAKIHDALERAVSLRAIRAIERSHICCLMIDGTLGPTDQDARLAQLIEDRGRAVIILVNKWDLRNQVEGVNSNQTADDLERRMPHISWAPHLFLSALTGKGCHRILDLAQTIYKNFDRRIPTSQLNRFLEDALHAHSPPQRHHHPVRIYYGTQTRVRPPTFTFFSNTPEGVGVGYKRYLANRLRERWDFEGAPIRLQFRKRRGIGEAKS